MKTNNKWKYQGDSRYEKVWEQMQLLGIQDVTTDKQHKNGTIVWRLPILSDKKNTYLEYASFKSGYVRNQGVDCHSNWQINKRKMCEPTYYPEYKWKTLDAGGYTQVKTGKYLKFTVRECELIPIEIDRLEYMLKYVIKNEFIKRANTVQQGNFIPKWQYENMREAVIDHGIDAYVAPEKKNEQLLGAMEAQCEDHEVRSVQVIIDGHRYKVI